MWKGPKHNYNRVVTEVCWVWRFMAHLMLPCWCRQAKPGSIWHIPVRYTVISISSNHYLEIWRMWKKRMKEIHSVHARVKTQHLTVKPLHNLPFPRTLCSFNTYFKRLCCQHTMTVTVKDPKVHDRPRTARLGQSAAWQIRAEQTCSTRDYNDPEQTPRRHSRLNP